MPARAIAAAPPRKRSRLRYWLLALLVLGALWLAGRPQRQLEARVNAAVALTLDCQFNAAQVELAALKMAHASGAQLDRLQAAIDSAVGTCARPARRASSEESASVRNLLAEARREIGRGNYQGAIGKMETCSSMIDAGNRACAAMRQRAERLQAERTSCIAGGRRWEAGRCL